MNLDSKSVAGSATRSTILAAAVDLASAEGLEGLTIGRLASELRMSKSGLFAHFGSKLELQLATLEWAGEIFIREIVVPADREDAGLPRLYRMLLEWLNYVERIVFRGGCFFAAASAEFDSRPGRVRDRIAELTLQWYDAIREEIRAAQKMLEIRKDVDADQLTFELHALAQEANWAYQLHGFPDAFELARKGMFSRLHESATSIGQSKLRPPSRLKKKGAQEHKTRRKE